MSTCERCKGHGCVHCESALPAGKTCADCRHVYRCTSIFGQKAEMDYCQFIPSRWSPAAVSPPPADQGEGR